MKSPRKINAYIFLKEGKAVFKEVIYRENVMGEWHWVPARPLGCCSILDRFRFALDVFLGRADALYWPGQ